MVWKRSQYQIRSKITLTVEELPYLRQNKRFYLSTGTFLAVTLGLEKQLAMQKGGCSFTGSNLLQEILQQSLHTHYKHTSFRCDSTATTNINNSTILLISLIVLQGVCTHSIVDHFYKQNKQNKQINFVLWFALFVLLVLILLVVINQVKIDIHQADLYCFIINIYLLQMVRIQCLNYTKQYTNIELSCMCSIRTHQPMQSVTSAKMTICL